MKKYILVICSLLVMGATGIMPDTTFQQGNSWAYHSKDYNWKPATRMLRYLVSNTSMGGNYLLNVGPKADGTLPVPAVRRLRETGQPPFR